MRSGYSTYGGSYITTGSASSSSGTWLQPTTTSGTTITTTGSTFSTPLSTTGTWVTSLPSKEDIDSIGDRLGKIEEILGILYCSDEVAKNIKNHEMLRDAYLKYKMLEKLIVEK